MLLPCLRRRPGWRQPDECSKTMFATRFQSSGPTLIDRAESMLSGSPWRYKFRCTALATLACGWPGAHCIDFRGLPV